MTRLFGILEPAGTWRRISRAHLVASFVSNGAIIAVLAWVYNHPTIPLTHSQADWLWENGRYIAAGAVIFAGVLIAYLVVLAVNYIRGRRGFG